MRVRSSRARSILLAGAKRSQRVEKLFECFFVIGQDDQHKPITLFQYPENVVCPLENEVLCFGLPGGSQPPRRIKRSESNSSLNEVLFGQLSNLEKSSNSFIFVLNTGEELLYGISVLSEEVAHLTPSFASSQQKQSSLKKTHISTCVRSYCLLSKLPFFQPHFRVLYSILGNERLHTLREASNLLEPSYHKADNSQTPVDPFTIQLLREYLDIVPPNASQSKYITIGGEMQCSVDLSSGSDLQLISRWTIPTLFKVLSAQDILHLYTALLLEKTIAIVSNDPGVLSAIILSVIPLLFPLVWQGPLITILPTTLSELLESPVPLIVGMKRMPTDTDKSNWNDPLIINLCSKETTLPGTNFPKHPERNPLTAIFGTFHDKFRELTSSSSSMNSVTPQCMVLVNKVVEEIRMFNMKLLDNDLFHSISDDGNGCQTGKGCDIEDLIKQVPRYQQKFMRVFIKTQQYSVHALDIQTQLKATTVEMGTTVSTLNTMISETTKERTSVQEEINELQKKLKRIDTRLITLKNSKVRLGDVTIAPIPCKKRSHTRNRSWFTGLSNQS